MSSTADILDRIEAGRPRCEATRHVNGKHYRCIYKQRHSGNHYHMVPYWVETTPGNQRMTTPEERFTISWGDDFGHEKSTPCAVPECEDKSRLNMTFATDWQFDSSDRPVCLLHAAEVLEALKARDEG